MDYFHHHPTITVSTVYSNKADAGVLVKARSRNIPCRIFNKKQLDEKEILPWLEQDAITHIVLAGFLWLIPTYFIGSFSNRIVNIHPSLLPKFGGKGMYGRKVHEAVLASGDSETGITIHLVNEKFDEGRILFQASCKIEKDDTPEKIAARVLVMEHANFPVVIEKWLLS